MPRFARNACGQLMQDQGMGWVPAPAMGAAISFVPPAFSFRIPTPTFQEVAEVAYQPRVYADNEGDATEVGSFFAPYDETGTTCNAGTKKVPKDGVLSCVQSTRQGTDTFGRPTIESGWKCTCKARPAPQEQNLAPTGWNL